MQSEGGKTYAEWQFDNGERTIEFYLKRYTRDEMFKGKKVLDIGCGAGGKSLYYASDKVGAKYVCGIDITEEYAKESSELAGKLGLSEKFGFICGDAAKTELPESSFDTIVMNDAMEHVNEPESVLKECMRLLVPGGRLYINFPPYYHPFGAHLSDAIGIPWAHAFFSQKSLIKAYKKLVRDLPDGERRIKFRISQRDDGTEYLSYINKMTLKRFKKILKGLDMNAEYYKEELFIRTPVLKEFFTRMAVCVITK